MQPAYIGGTCAIPVKAVKSLGAILKTTTVKYQPLGADEAVQVAASFVSEDGEFVHVPRQYGITLAQSLGLELVDETSPGFEASYAPVNPPRKYQQATLSKLLQACQQYYDVVFRAHTGWGKTYGALWIGSQLRTTTLIVVDQDNLREQWEETARKHFGFTKATLGRVQGPICDYVGKDIVIATVQTLSQKTYDPAFYEYFGLVILDEAHIMGAPCFSQVLLDFPAGIRLAVSATPKRKDTLQKLLDQHLGPIRVAADKEHNASAVYFARNHNVYSWYANTAKKKGRLLNEVAEDGARNLKLAETIQWLYETGRDVIILSDRTEHMRHLANLCYYMGMPEEDLGIYTGETQMFRWAKDPTPLRRPAGWERDTEYTPVSLQLISKKLAPSTLKRTKETARILFCTYGKAAKGFDEARLCGGVDATPRSAAEQVHGRILRGGGAKAPIWVTMLDWNNPGLLGGFIARIRDYLKSNGEIYEWLDEGGLQPWQPYDLIDHVSQQQNRIKSMRIERGRDGRYTLLTRTEQMRSALQIGRDTNSRTHHNADSRVGSSAPDRHARSAPRQEAAPSTAVSRVTRSTRPLPR